jgi:folate-binding protein YgfZ
MADPFPNPLTDLHQAIDDAEFADFGGIPIVTTFGEVPLEYAAIHKSCGLLDQSWRGVLEVTGKDRHEFLGNLITNKTWDKLTKIGLAAGSGVQAFLLNLKGRVAADLVLIERGEKLLVDMDRRLVSTIRATLDRYLFSEKVQMVDRSRTHTRLGLHGPGAAAVLYDASGVDVSALPEFGSNSLTLFGVPLDVWREDQSVSPGYHLLMANDDAAKVWSGFLGTFADEGRESNKRRLRRIGWSAFNTTRIEAGKPMLGIDYEPAPPSVPGKKATADAPEDPATRGILPAETGLFDRAVDVNKGCYLGQEIVARMYSRKVVVRKIVSFRMDADALPIAGAPVLDTGDNQVGIVTSSTISPIRSGTNIGLALVKKPLFEIGSVLRIPAEGAVQTAQVVEAGKVD